MSESGHFTAVIVRLLARRSPQSAVAWLFAGLATAAVLGAAAVAAQAGGGIAVVNSTGDAGDANPGDGTCNTVQNGTPQCTLRAAIQEVNAGSASAIHFDIQTSDPGYNAATQTWTISPTSELPQVADVAAIDGRTHFAYAGAPVIEVDGSNAGNVEGLTLLNQSSGSSLFGLSVINWEGQGVNVSGRDIEVAHNYIGLRSDGVTQGPNQNGLVLAGGAQNVTVRDNVLSGNTGGSGLVLVGATTRSNDIDGNLIGTTADGTSATGVSPAGISIVESSNNVIGGNAPNIISGNAGDGIVIRGSSGNRIVNNVIGASITGAPLGNGWSGIQLLEGATFVMIGAPGSGNTIVSNARSGIQLEDVGQVSIGRNFIGIDGGTALGNMYDGIRIETQSGDVQLEDNTIAYNVEDGISVASDTTGTISISENMILANGELGIDLANDGPTPNDAGDADTGVNDLLNYPEIVATIQGMPGRYTAQYVVSAPAGQYRARIYQNPFGIDPSGFGEGQILVVADLINHPGGEATYLTTQSFSGASGDQITAHLQETNNGPASEFSQSFTVTNASGTATVNSTDDEPDINPGDGLCNTGQLNSEGNIECTLRAAIQEANANPDLTVIDFDIPVSDPGQRTVGADDIWRISIVNGQLPAITTPTEIDGATQAGFQLIPNIEIDGNAGVSPLDGFVYTAGSDGSIVRNLAFGNFGENAVEVNDSNGIQIQNNWFGTFRGSQSAPNATGVAVLGTASNTEIGGATNGLGNLFLSNTDQAIYVDGFGVQNTMVGHNTIGDGSVALLNGHGILVTGDAQDTAILNNTISASDDFGVLLRGADGATLFSNTIETSGADNVALSDGSSDITIGMIGAGNTIVGSADDGIQIQGAGANVIIEGNNIGQQADGTPAGNLDNGIDIAFMSEPLIIRDNTIVNNGGDGISLFPSTSGAVTISRNSIADNAVDAIDLNNDSPTPNDPGDADSGPNSLLNKPEIVNVAGIGGSYEVEFLITAPPGNYVLELFESPNVYPSGLGHAAEFVSPTDITVPGPTPVVVQAPGTAGNYFSATLTDKATGETSEIGNGAILPPSLPPSNQPPTLTNPGLQTSNEGDTINLPLTATDPDGDPLTWTVNGLPPGLTFNPNTNQINGTLNFTSAGTHTVDLTVNDGVNPPVTETFTWTVNDTNQPPTLTNPGLQTSNEGDTINLPLTATDPDGDPLTWTVNGLPPGLTFNPNTNQINGTLNFTSAGTYPITITVDDNNNPQVTRNSVWLVINNNREPVIQQLPNTSVMTGDPVSLQPIATDLDGDALTWSVNGLAPGLTFDSDTGEISGTATTVGTTQITLTVDDGLGGTDTMTFTFIVTPPATTTTTTTTTTLAPTTTAAPTTLAPTTTTTPVVAPITSTTVAPTTTTTVVAESIPPALAFAELLATDDQVITAENQVAVDIFANDSFGNALRLVSVSQPDVGSVEIIDDQIVVNMPPSFAGELRFQYTISDASGVESTAEVQVLSANVLAATRDTLEVGPPPPVESVGGVADRATSLFTALVEVRLTSLQLGLITLAPLVLGLLFLLFGRREKLLSITATSRGETVGFPLRSGSTNLRHDELVWNTRRTRRRSPGTTETKVQLPDGREGWVDSSRLTDTGY